MKKIQFLSERQSRLMVIFFAVLFALSALLFVLTARSWGAGRPSTAPAMPVTASITGEWVARRHKTRTDQLQISFSRRTGQYGYNQMGDTLGLNDLQGLSADALSAAKTDVSFTILREAGSITCEGEFRDGSGTGFWTFTPNPGFLSAMRDRGYPVMTDDEVLKAAFHNLTAKYVDELKAAGYADLDLKQILRASGHEITAAYIREMRLAGYTSLSMDELIRARNHDIDPAFVGEAKAMGFDKQPLDTLIRMQNHEIDREFVGQMKAAGFPDLSVDELIRLKNHDVTLAFVNEIRGEGYNDISPQTAVRLRNHDIDRDVIRRARAQGYTDVSLEELVRLNNRGAIR